MDKRGIELSDKLILAVNNALECNHKESPVLIEIKELAKSLKKTFEEEKDYCISCEHSFIDDYSNLFCYICEKVVRDDSTCEGYCRRVE